MNARAAVLFGRNGRSLAECSQVPGNRLQPQERNYRPTGRVRYGLEYVSFHDREDIIQ